MFIPIPFSLSFVFVIFLSSCTPVSLIQDKNSYTSETPSQALPQSPSPTPTLLPDTPPTESPTPESQPTLTPTPNIAIWDTKQLWANRAKVVNETLTIVDVVSHESRCPDVVGVSPEQCTTVVWFGEIGKNPFPVYQGGEWTSCQGRPNECNGWSKGQTYQIVATLRQKQLNSGKPLDSYYLEVVIISRR